LPWQAQLVLTFIPCEPQQELYKMNMTQRAIQMMKQWGILLGLLALLHIVLFAAWIILEPAIMRTPALSIGLMVAYLILDSVALGYFVRQLGKASSPPEYEEARKNGLPAKATVLSIEQTNWKVKPTRNFRLQKSPYRREYQMRIRVSRAGQPDYETDLAEFLTGDQVPQRGSVISVKVHPQHPDIIVMMHD
jgi:hypothetical protein